MGLSSFGVKSLADNLAVADEDAAHHGVGAGVPGRLPRQLDAPAHVVRVHVARLRLAPHAGREPPRAAADRDAGAARGGRWGCWAGGEMGPRDERGGDHVPCAGEKPNSNRDVCGDGCRRTACRGRRRPAVTALRGRSGRRRLAVDAVLRLRTSPMGLPSIRFVFLWARETEKCPPGLRN
jgi:hypothetical protein